ncbi:3-alpha,7-alpha,12-alpha-trihydroxy-5-beta-cholest-24-enoyl-CoA hydratase, partial [Mycobacterium tuberculosis]
PGFAAAAGFPRPLLPGLCPSGLPCPALVAALLASDAPAVAGYGARFAGVASPGATLPVPVWPAGRRLVA